MQVKLLGHSTCIVVVLFRQGQDGHLVRCEPKGEVARRVLDEHGRESLHGAEGCAMHHDGRLLGVVLVGIFQLESFRQVIVYLDRAQLPAASDGILDHEVELGAVEGCFTIFDFCGKSFLATSLYNGAFCQSPVLVSANVLVVVVGVSQRDLGLEVESKGFEHNANDVHHVEELLLHLVWTAEDVSIILSKGTHAREAVQLA